MSRLCDRLKIAASGGDRRSLREHVRGLIRESHLTRLFARTGCRSRGELAAANLEGRLLEVAA